MGTPITECLISGKIHQWMRSGGTTMTMEIPRISQLFALAAFTSKTWQALEMSLDQWSELQVRHRGDDPKIQESPGSDCRNLPVPLAS